MDKPVFQNLPPEASAYISALERGINEMRDELERLRNIIRLANKARFGSSSEKAKYIVNGQMSLSNEAEALADETEPEPAPETVVVEKHTRKPKRTKEQLAETLPVEEIILEIPEEERKCNICEGEIHPIGKTFVRRELNIIPAKAYVTEIYQTSYACGDCEKETDESNIIKTPVPVPVIKRGLASPNAVAHTIYQKYVNAVPLYRQEKDWANFGVSISRATLANWIIYTALYWLTPLWNQLKTLLLGSIVIQADETVVQVLKEPGKTPQSDSLIISACGGNAASPRRYLPVTECGYIAPEPAAGRRLYCLSINLPAKRNIQLNSSKVHSRGFFCKRTVTPVITV